MTPALWIFTSLVLFVWITVTLRVLEKRRRIVKAPCLACRRQQTNHDFENTFKTGAF